ncbi:MAG: anthranilate synthase component I family protein [Candidatus Muiribacteriaceae bacterium]
MKLEVMIREYRVPDNIEDYFFTLTRKSGRKNSVFLQSRDKITKLSRYTIGSACPAYSLNGRGEDFEIRPLSETGEHMVRYIGSIPEVSDISDRDGVLYGSIIPEKAVEDQMEKIKAVNHGQLIQRCSELFIPENRPHVIQYAGLFGAISYDFIDQFEDLPKNRTDTLEDPDYSLYYLDNLFVLDHEEDIMYVVSCVPGNYAGGENSIAEIHEQRFSVYREALDKTIKFSRNPGTIRRVMTDTGQKEYCTMVQKAKENILSGDIFQIVLSRSIFTEFNGDPWDIYLNLADMNPSPYMFFIDFEGDPLIGASPEMFLKVQGDKEKTVNIHPIAGTRPRGMKHGHMDEELDIKYETELRLDGKELAEHAMLVDLARNDVARVSRAGTRKVTKAFSVEKYSHVQHLVSEVIGVLRDDLNAMNAYMAVMNMGTLTGAPKVKAMELIREYEADRRGFYGGSVGYITPHGDMDSAIVIRAVRVKDDKAYIRAGAGIVYDSIPEKEFEETERKLRACLRSLTGSQI